MWVKEHVKLTESDKMIMTYQVASAISDSMHVSKSDKMIMAKRKVVNRVESERH
jgi:hypothetical protein